MSVLKRVVSFRTVDWDESSIKIIAPESVDPITPFKITVEFSHPELIGQGNMLGLYISQSGKRRLMHMIQTKGEAKYEIDNNVIHTNGVAELSMSLYARDIDKDEISHLVNRVLSKPAYITVRESDLDAISIRFSVNKTTAHPMEQLILSWEFVPGTRPRKYCYFGLFPTADPGIAMCKAMVDNPAEDKGSRVLYAPAAPGIYEARFFALGLTGIRLIAKSDQLITVTM